MRNNAEERAVRHYRLRGYRILGTNVWAGGNEIDLIARRGGKLIFCEVKSKSGVGRGEGLERTGRGGKRSAPRSSGDSCAQPRPGLR